MFRNTIFLILCLFTLINVAQAQKPKTFRKEKAEFIQDVAKFLLKPNVKESKDPFLIKVKIFFNSDILSDLERKQIYKISNGFLKRKARAYPTYSDYIECLMIFYDKNIDKTSFNTWHNNIQKILKNKKIRISNTSKLLTQTKLLLTKDIIYKSYSVVWKGENLIFNYEIEDNKLAINFAPFNLYCFSQRDSSLIINTNGKYFPLENKWLGVKGKVTWEKAGKNPEYEFAEFGNYSINMTKNYFSVDTVKYFNTKLASNGVLGKLQDKTIQISKPEKAIYPKFTSFKTDISFTNLYKDIDYTGGIHIRGANFYSNTDKNNKARINIRRNDTCFIRAFSDNFSFKNNKIIATDTRVEILLDDKKIEHPGLLFNFNNSKRELNLVRNGEGNAMSPYFDYYHNIIMDFELLTWKLSENKMHFKKMYGSNRRVANFESLNYFSNNNYRKLMGMGDVNPLVSIQDYSKKNRGSKLSGKDYARYVKLPINQIIQQLVKLSFGGFVSYNTLNDEIKIQKRLNDYIQASRGNKDYDVIKFVSDTEPNRTNLRGSLSDTYGMNNENNASLNLDSYNLKINGVRRITVSDSQNVIIKPRNYKLELKRNLNFDFDGEIQAGSFNMFGDNFHFVYKDFKVHLNKIDSVQITTKTKKNNGYRLALVNNVIENVTGNLSIDDPGNKAGLKKHPEFPIFNSTDTSFVYYDKKNIQKGVYTRDQFYFKLAPYTISRLNKFKPNDLQLKGELVSYKIFPNIIDSLTIMNDLSLGFERETPIEGYSIYGKGEGVFRKKLILNRRGLTGDGELDFINSTTKATDFLFLPRKVVANAYSFKLEEGERRLNPNVEGDSIITKWLPYNEELFITSNDIPFSMFSDFARLSGTLRLTPNEITGNGRMELKDAKLESQYYSYTRTSIRADTALFKIYDKDRKGYAFEADSLNAYIDLEKETGLFRTTISDNISKFPDNKYLCYLNSFMWYMEDNNIKFGSKNRDLIADTWKKNQMHLIPIKSMSKFVSTKKGQDSLSFYTPLADYDVTNKIIKADYVYFIDVADAVVYPSDGKITIERNAKIKTIHNAKISTGINKKKHIIENAKIDIFGRYSFIGNGEYRYVDEDKREQFIKLSVIDVDSSKHTRARGMIREEQNFTLSPKFEYKGKVELRSHNDYLKFDGSTKITETIKNIDNKWLRFKAQINPEDIKIPILPKKKNDRNSNVYSDIFITSDSLAEIYPSFISKKKRASHISIINARGLLTYDKKEEAYRIAPKEKLDSMILPGNNINLYKDKITARGRLNLGMKFKFAKQMCAGSLIYKLKEQKIDTSKNINYSNPQLALDIMYGIDFALPEEALEVLQESFIGAKLKMSMIDPESNYIKLSELIGAPRASKAIAKMNENGYYKDIPSILEKTLFFNQLNMIWVKKRSAYISSGKISIGNIGEKQINRIANGKIEIKKRKKGDKIRIYLYLEDEVWYYFEYCNGIMYTASSENKYNTIILTKNVKGKKKKKKKKKNIDEFSEEFENEDKNEDKIDFQPMVKKYTLELAPTSLKMGFLQSFDTAKKKDEEKTDDKKEVKETGKEDGKDKKDTSQEGKETGKEDLKDKNNTSQEGKETGKEDLKDKNNTSQEGKETGKEDLKDKNNTSQEGKEIGKEDLKDKNNTSQEGKETGKEEGKEQNNDEKENQPKKEIKEEKKTDDIEKTKSTKE